MACLYGIIITQSVIIKEFRSPAQRHGRCLAKPNRKTSRLIQTLWYNVHAGRGHAIIYDDWWCFAHRPEGVAGVWQSQTAECPGCYAGMIPPGQSAGESACARRLFAGWFCCKAFREGNLRFPEGALKSPFAGGYANPKTVQREK